MLVSFRHVVMLIDRDSGIDLFNHCIDLLITLSRCHYRVSLLFKRSCQHHLLLVVRFKILVIAFCKAAVEIIMFILVVILGYHIYSSVNI